MPIIKTIQKYKLVLDTHVWIWLLIGSQKLSVSFRKAINHAQEHDAILISPISIWEVGMLVAKRRIELEKDTLDFIEEALNLPGFRLTPITPKIAILSTRLPGGINSDPADRILISTTHEENAILVTCDSNLIEYGKDKFINVHDPS
jgi:PIN domain nuclease of toxin-antitoxin system